MHSATRYITPKDMLAGRQQEIHAERDGKLEAREKNGRFVVSRPPDVETQRLLARCAGDTRPTVVTHP